MIEKLKSLQSQVTDESLKSKIQTALDTWQDVPETELDEKEKSIITNLINKAETNLNSEAEKKNIENEEMEKGKITEEKNRKKQLVSSLSFPHIDYIKTEQPVLDIEIKKKITGWNLQYGKLKANPDNEKIKEKVLQSSQNIKKSIMSKEQEKIDSAKKEAAETAKTELLASQKAEKEAREKEETDKKALEIAEQQKEPLKPVEEKGFFGRMRDRLAE